MIVAVPTEGDRGIRDRISGIFAKAPFFTFVEVIDSRRGEISVQENEASKLVQGTGPIVMKDLKDKGVDVVLARAEHHPMVKRTQISIQGCISCLKRI